MGFLDWLFRILEDKRPPFVIAVDPIDDEADRTPDKLRITHPSCSGGVMDTHLTDTWLWLCCRRCKAKIHVEGGEFGIGAIYNTATDGVGRWLRGDFHEGIQRHPNTREPEYSGIFGSVLTLLSFINH